MPPKKPNQPSNKNVQKAKAKAVEDKTFGMKNKNKSKKVEKFIKGLQASAKGPQKDKMQTFEDKKKKEEEAERKKLEQALLKPVVQPKVPVGVDPKSIVCEFFKMGSCTKGNKCKYSHNLEQARKSEKIDIYTDKRNAEDGKPEESMESWDQAKLEKVIETKRGEENKNLNLKTTIVCKYFLEAIEKKKYGWFWECPNGGDKCQYLHCLPPGFQLKIKEEKKEEEEDETPLEDILEEERNKLTTRTPLNLEIFLKWKEEKKKEREIKRAEEQKQKESDIKSGKSMRSGRDLFVFNPDLFVDDDNVIAVEEFEPEQKDDTPVINIEVTGTSIRTTVINKGKEEAPLEQVHIKDGGEGKEEDHNSGDEFVPEDVASDSEGEGVEVEEELFNEDEVPDVEDVDE